MAAAPCRPTAGTSCSFRRPPRSPSNPTRSRSGWSVSRTMAASSSAFSPVSGRVPTGLSDWEAGRILRMFRRHPRAAGGVPHAPAPGAVRGVVRSDRRTKRLVGRLQPGEIALIDHEDLDRVAAEGLVERQVRAVVNVARSATGAYPNLGPLVLAAAGIPLIDAVAPDLFDILRDGDTLEIEDGRILAGGAVVAKGEPLGMELAQERLDASKRQIGAALERFAENTIEYLRDEREYLIEAIRLPEIDTDLGGRHVLVVVRGYGYKADLASLRGGYISDFPPVLVGVDGGADALPSL